MREQASRDSQHLTHWPTQNLALGDVERHFAALDPVIANDWDKIPRLIYSHPLLAKELSRIRMHGNELVRLFSLYDANVKTNEALSGPMRLHYFINGLPELYQFELLRRDISSFEEAQGVIWHFHTARHPELFSVYAHTCDSMELDGVDRPRNRSSTSPFHSPAYQHSFPKTKYPYRRTSPPRSNDDSAEATPLVPSRPPYSDRHCHSPA